MNIFYLDKNPKICAEYHCDKHIVKMILEYAQLMSTAHRIIDGKQYTENNKGRISKRWQLSDGREDILYKATHINHPSAIWARASVKNYLWLFSLWENCLNEYSRRYNKTHACERLKFCLKTPPTCMVDADWSEPPQAMPDECKVKGNSKLAYQQYYIMKKNNFARWTKTDVPKWYSYGILDVITVESQAMGLYD